MIRYNKYSFIYPPRPEHKIPRSGLDIYDNGVFGAQPKLNGSCCELYTGRNTFTQKGRHNNTLSVFTLREKEVFKVFGKTNWNLLVGEYMNKSKKDERDNVFNHKFVLFDQLVVNNEYLLGTTFDERINIMLDIYDPIDETDYLYKLSDNIYMVKTFYKDFCDIWDNITKIDMYEGLVMKRLNGKLKRGTTEKNNTSTQFKVRKSTKLYSY